MLGHLRAVPLLYFRPVRAINALLDHGSGGTALLLAVASSQPRIRPRCTKSPTKMTLRSQLRLWTAPSPPDYVS